MPDRTLRPNIVSGLLASCIGVQGCADVTFRIDTFQNRHAISPLIYGTNQCRLSQVATFCRIGGNRWTAYNWELNVSNAGADFHYANDRFLSSSTAYGSAVAERIATAKSLAADVLITIPIIGRVAGDNAGPLVPPEPTSEELRAAFLSHFRTSTPTATGLVPPDLADDQVQQQGFLKWTNQTYAAEATGTSSTHLHFGLGNEPELWFNRFKYLHPDKTTFDEMVTLSKEYGALIKSIFPTSLVFGPVTSNWDGLTGLYNEGKSGFLEYYLGKMKPLDGDARLLDVLDFHWYPEKRVDGIKVIEDDGTTPNVDMEWQRGQVTRSLWDPSYDEETYVTAGLEPDPTYNVKSLRLLRRIKEIVQSIDPGVRLAITEYYYGGGAHPSGAVAQADALGIFGREGVYAAALWEYRPINQMIYAAFNMYLNYDGAGARFGTTSVQATSSVPREATVYASDGAAGGRIVVVAINRHTSSRSVLIKVRHNQVLRHAKIYRLASNGLIQQVASLDVDGSFRINLPETSVSTIALDP